MFEFIDVNFAFSAHSKSILKDFSEVLPSQGILGIVGPNGCGKSTFLKMCIGLYTPTSGSIFYETQNLSSYSRLALAQKMAWLSSRKSYTSQNNVLDYISLGRSAQSNWLGLLKSLDHKLIQEALEFWEIEHWKTLSILNLSDGERQRVELARIWAQNTPLILMDEPTAHFDPARKEWFWQKLKSSQKCIWVVDHDLVHLLKNADHLLVFDRLGHCFLTTPTQAIQNDELRKIFEEDGLKLSPDWLKGLV